MARLTGLPVEIVRRNFARIPPAVFIKEFDRAHGQVLSRYDGSVSGPDPSPASTWPRGPDPVLDSTVPLWTSAFVQYAQDELGYKTDMTYQLLNREARDKWDFGTSPTRQGYAGVLEDIQDARAANPALEVLIATGYTDLITPYLAPAYLVNQLSPLEGASPITIEDYAGGHMLYLRPDTRRTLRKDVEAMYERALKSSRKAKTGQAASRVNPRAGSAKMPIRAKATREPAMSIRSATLGRGFARGGGLDRVRRGPARGASDPARAAMDGVPSRPSVASPSPSPARPRRRAHRSKARTRCSSTISR